MAVEMGVRSLTKISKILGLSFASFAAYRTFRSIGTKHLESSVMIFSFRSIGNQGWGKLLELKFQNLEGIRDPHGSYRPRFLTPLIEAVESIGDV